MNQWAGGLIVTNDGRLVLQQREDKPGITLPGKVAMFGGTVEPNETVEKAAERELLEELNLKVNGWQLEKLGVYQKTKELDGEDYEIHVFLVRDVDPKGLELREGKAIRYVSRGENLDEIELTRITRLAIEDYYKRGDIEGRSGS